MDQVTPGRPDKARAILSAALAEFQEHGFAAASMDRITARAGVSKRTVYRHFASKENLFRAIVEGMGRRMAAALDVAFDPGRPAEAQLRALAWAEGRLLMEEETLLTARMVIAESLREPRAAEAVLSGIDPTASIRRFFAEAAEAGALRTADPQAATSEFLGLIKSRAFWPRLAEARPLDEAAMRPIIESTVAMMMARYGA